MKKKIYLILTIIISLFIFSNGVEAIEGAIESGFSSGILDKNAENYLGKCTYSYNGDTLYIYFNENDVKVECSSCFYTGLKKDLSNTEYETHKPLSSDDFAGCSIKTFNAKKILPYYYADKCPSAIYIGVQQIGLQGVSHVTDFLGVTGFLESVMSAGNFGCWTHFSLSQKNDWEKNLLFDENKATFIEKEFYVKVEQPTEFVPEEPIADCEDLFGEELVADINKIMNIVKIVIPILLIAFGIIDFTKAIFDGSEDEMAKSQKKFLKRVFASILVFFVPIFINLILTIANKVWINIIPDTCIEYDITN